MAIRTETQPLLRRTAPRLRSAAWLPGAALALGIAALARLASAALPLVPDVVIALVAGIVLNNVVRLPAVFAPGIAWTLKIVLRVAIIAFGAGLSVQAIVGTGGATLVLVVAIVATSFALGLALARIFKLSGVVGTLIGAGTAICGGSAILALAPILKAKDEETAYALTTIFAFNVIALLAYPPIGHALALSATAFGSWTGTAINDTSVVVATGYLYSHAAGNVATIVKLTRTVLLVPLAVGIGISMSRGASLGTAARTMPWFILGFVAMAACNSAGAFSPAVAHAITTLAGFLIVMVLAAVGCNVDIAKMRRMGAKPMLAGLGLATIMSLVSLTLVHVLRIA
jgi:uncharacterized integral membrane protein (TIGR00698 family)